MVKTPKQRSSTKHLNSGSDGTFTVPAPPLTPTKHVTRPPVNVTPPKQRKMDENSPPSTPSTLLSKLVLNSPEKPSKLLQSARRALHSTLPSQLPGRENELKYLQKFIGDCIDNDCSASLYISGPPGTGKTAALSLTLDKIQFDLKKVFINCTAIKSARTIYSRIAKDLNLKPSGRTEKDYLNAVEKYMTKTCNMVLLVLDEIDQLDSKNQSILYTIFEWPSKIGFKVILIGIANALDLTDRTLPFLQIRSELKPKLMHFSPYTKQQIVEIFMERLKDLNKVFSPIAIQMLAGKVAAISGDVRRALDIGRRVLEIAEQNFDQAVLKPKENLTDTQNVDLQEVLKVLNNVYGTTQTLHDENDSIPLQQRIVTCSLLLMMKKAKNKDVTIGKLHEVYKRVCEKRNLSAVDQAEFVGLCSLIETRGIIHVIGKKEPRLHKISLQWDEEEVAAVLNDKQLMSSILQDDKCLGRL